MTSYQERAQQAVFEVLLNETTTLGVPQMTDISDKVAELLLKREIILPPRSADVGEAEASMIRILASRNQATSEKGQATIAGGLFAIAEAIREVGPK